MVKERKKTWGHKVAIVQASHKRITKDEGFGSAFYHHLFFLNPKLKTYFENTDFVHQDKALAHGLGFLLDSLDPKNEFATQQLRRLARTHSIDGLNIHPHAYYYWVEALVMTVQKLDPYWEPDLGYYWREVITLPVYYMISRYHPER